MLSFSASTPSFSAGTLPAWLWDQKIHTAPPCLRISKLYLAFTLQGWRAIQGSGTREVGSRPRSRRPEGTWSTSAIATYVIPTVLTLRNMKASEWPVPERSHLSEQVGTALGAGGVPSPPRKTELGNDHHDPSELATPCTDRADGPMSALVIILTDNERGNLSPLADRLLGLGFPSTGYSRGQVMRRPRVADDLVQSFPHLSVIHRGRRLGTQAPSSRRARNSRC